MAALCLLAGLLGLGLSAAGPASAHAQLLSTDPAPGARLDHAPQQISLTFGEAVSFVPGGFRLLDRAGSSLTLGEPQHRGDTVIVPLTDTPGDGAYVFSWRVVSADTHPVAGAIPFTVGAAVPGATLPAFAAGSTPGSTRVLADVDRWLGYAGAIGGAGVLGFGLLCWPAARTDRIARRLGVVGGVLVALTAVAGLPLQASAAGGEPLGEVFGDDSIRAVLATSYGHAALGRIVLGLLLAALVATRDCWGGCRGEEKS
jgi:copper transport protein